MKEETRISICNVLGVHSSSNSERYLGLPSMVGRNKYQAFKELKERLQKRVDGRSARLLSVGGRKVLIKSVLQSVPIYAMSCFYSPILCAKIWNRYLQDFGGRRKR